MDEVGDPDAVPVAVTAHDHDVQVVVRESGAGGHRQRAPVKAVHAVGPEETR